MKSRPVQRNNIDIQTFSAIQQILDEKEKKINKLEAQLENQRLQLEFYLKKDMSNPIRQKFQHTSVDAITDNYTASLMIYNFYKEHGLESPLRKFIHTIIEGKEELENVIDELENTIEGISETLKKFLNPQKLLQNLGNFDLNNHFIEIFNNVLCVISSLKEKASLLNYNIEKMVACENKKYEAAVQIANLPDHQQLFHKYMVGLKAENLELQSIVREFLKHFRNTTSSTDNYIEKEPNFLETKIKQLKHKDEENSSKLLKTMYQQAVSLLTLSREQKKQYTKKISILERENRKFRDIIQNYQLNHIKRQMNRKLYVEDIEKRNSAIQISTDLAQDDDKEKRLRTKKSNIFKKLEGFVDFNLPNEDHNSSNNVTKLPGNTFQSSSGMEWFL